MPTIRPGLTFVWGKDQRTARALLDACDELGIDQHVVNTVANGFIVPDEVADAARPAMTDETPDETPDETQQF